MAKEQKLTLSQIHEEVARNPKKIFLVRVLEFNGDIPKTGEIVACTDTHEEVLVRLDELRQQKAIDRYAIFGGKNSEPISYNPHNT